MRVLVNTTNLVKGGALQVTVALAAEIMADPQGIDWHFALSRQTSDDIRRQCGRLPEQSVEFPVSPSKNRQVRRDLAALADRCGADVVFTVFGPAFVRFSQQHLMGCATPWVTNSTWLSYRTLPTIGEKLRMWAWSRYCAWWLTRADAWVTESPAVKDGMCRRLRLPASQIAVVSNTCAQQYFAENRTTPFPQPGQKTRLLCFSAAYPHKSLDLIPDVAAKLTELLPACDFEFVLTLPQNDPIWRRLAAEAERRGVAARLVNRGPIPVAQGPDLYRDCHVCFMPTVLECFTATYPEAMAMGLPIVTSDLDFARSVCGDAALYFQPRNPTQAATQLQQLLTAPHRWNELIERGKQVLQALPQPRQRYLAYVELLRALFRRSSSPATTVANPTRQAA